MNDATDTKTAIARTGIAISRRNLVAAAGGVAAAIAIGGQAGAMGSKHSTRYQDFSVLRQQNAELVFQYWGSPQEQTAVKDMVDGFNQQNPNIKVRAQYVALDGYTEKMTTQLAGNSLPDVAYIGSDMLFQWAKDGHTLDLTSYIQSDTEAGEMLDNSLFTYGGGKVASTSLAITINCLFYNKKIFSDAGVQAPPTTGDAAWTWDQFVATAKQLTIDQSGKNANDPSFDPKKIKTYGVTVPYWMDMLWSNNSDIATQDGTKLTMSTPESLDVFQKLQDLIYVHHVSPTPAAAQSLPATDVLMRTGKLAMDCNGAFKILDYANSKDLQWGLGVLPKIQIPATDVGGAACMIAATTKNPDAAYEFYRWRYSPERINLYKDGLWMPVLKKYYTDPASIKLWLDPANGVYPEEAQQVLIDYPLKYNPKQAFGYWLANLAKLGTDVINPAITSLLANEGTAQAIMTKADQAAAPLMQGRN